MIFRALSKPDQASTNSLIQLRHRLSLELVLISVLSFALVTVELALACPSFTSSAVTDEKKALLSGRGKAKEPTSRPGPSLVSVCGKQLVVRKRNQDGSFALPTSYIIRGVNWSPASQCTNGTTAARRLEFGIWAATDIPLIGNMNVNTVRTYMDPGLDADGIAVLDQLYNNGIMVVMTVDDAVNDLTRVQQAVSFYKDHPAVLMWTLGSEWNINRYFGVASSVLDAAQRTQTAASLIKSLDPNHPVASSYGEIDIDAGGLRLADTQNYVNNICTSVDVWGLNIYRSNTFGSLFDQWHSISGKPMLIGEFGTDVYRSATLGNPPFGIEDGVVQAQWDLSEWNDLFENLSANNPSKVALGGFVFEWNDEWWKAQAPCSQQTDGFVLFNGHPDNFANEEYFGIVDVSRQPRLVYGALATAFDPAYQPSRSATYRATSRGASAQQYNSQLGVVWFFKNGASLYTATGGAGGGRGFNVVAIDPCSGSPIQPVQHFDTWATRNSGAALCDMISFLDLLPNGTVVMIAVADEAGLNAFPPNDCMQLNNLCIEAFFQRLEALGSRQIRNYCYWNSWAMIAVKGEGMAHQEQLGSGVEVSVQATLRAPAGVSAAREFFGSEGGEDSVDVSASNSCSWTATSNANWITITSASTGTGNGTVTYAVRENFTGSTREASMNIAGQIAMVTQDGGLGAHCTYSLSPKFQSFSACGGTGVMQVLAEGRCAWHAISNVSWIRITSSASGISNGTLAYSVEFNPSTGGRKGVIAVAGQTFSVKQKGTFQ